MIKSSIIIFTLLLSIISYSQVPNKMSFQTVVRNSLGKLVVSKNIGVRLSVLKTTATGTAVYVEQHTKTSNANGLLTLELGTGTVATGSFSTIDWSQGPYFLKTEMDVNGGTNYTISGVTEFLTVPYAMSAKNSKTAEEVKSLSNGTNIGDMNFWNGTTWVPLTAGAQNQALLFCDGKPTWVEGGVCPGKITSLNCANSSQVGTLIHGKIVNNCSISIPYTGGNGGPFKSQVFASNGVLGLKASLNQGLFTLGNGTLQLNISGTPTSSGIASFPIIIGGNSCTINCTVLAGAISQINCVSPIHEGGLILSNEPVSNLIKTFIQYTDGNGGFLPAINVPSTGVTGLFAKIQTGNIVEGDGSLLVTYSGTPATNGTASFNLSIGGLSCTIKKTVEIKGVIGSLNCSVVNTGTLTKGEVASSVTSVFSYTGGNSGKYNSQQILSTGVIGLTANLLSGTLANGNGSLSYSISGVPTSSGTASFAINIGGKTCVLTRNVSVKTGVVSALNCSQVSHIGTLIVNKAVSQVNTIISYTGGNGGEYSGKVIPSTGVTGLNATLVGGSLENGNGNLSFTITGTPTSIGTASFSVNFANNICVFTRVVQSVESTGINFTSKGDPIGVFKNVVSDIEGNQYKTVQIGTQQWMAENLKTSKYNDGSIIPNVSDSAQWSNLGTGAWCFYENKTENNAKFGKLYNWYAVSSTTNGNKNICPVGWHVPKDKEWTDLFNYLGGDTLVGGKMKEIDTMNWLAPNLGATNTSLFTALPGGIRLNDNDNTSNWFLAVKEFGVWWSDSEVDLNSSNFTYLNWEDSKLYISNNSNEQAIHKKSGFSIRCLKD